MLSTQTILLDGTFDKWRDHARALLASNTVPEDILWQDPHDRTENLFQAAQPPVSKATSSQSLRVPSEFLSLARSVSCHRDPRRWHLLYRTLFRLTHGEPHLLAITVDVDVH